MMIQVVVTAAVMTSKVTPAKKLLKTIVRLGWESLLAVSSVLVYASEKKCQNRSIVESPNYWVPWWSKWLPFTICRTPLSSAFWTTSDVWIQDLHKVLAYLSVWSKVITHNTLLVLIFFLNYQDVDHHHHDGCGLQWLSVHAVLYSLWSSIVKFKSHYFIYSLQT